MIALKLSSTGDAPVLAALERLALNGQDKAELLDQLGFAVSENTRLRFQTGTAPDGSSWVPSIRARTQGGQTLLDKGVLRNSITHAVNVDSVEVGTNVPYGPWLHFGAEIRPVHGEYLKFKIPGLGFFSKKAVTLPARPWLGIDEEDSTEILTLIGNFLDPARQ